MDSREVGPKGPRGPAGTMLVPALAVAALVFLAAGTGGQAAGPAEASPSNAIVDPAPAAAPAKAGLARLAAAAPAAAPGEEPDDGEPLTQVRVAILNATGKTGGANKVALLLTEVKRQALQDQIGLNIEVVNLSAAEGAHPRQSVLFYRPGFLRAALAMARAIPGEQHVLPMRPAELKRAGVDVEIVVAQDMP